MANEEILRNNTTPVQATTNPQTNMEAMQPISIPLQIQPMIAQPQQQEAQPANVQNLQVQDQQVSNAPVPVSNPQQPNNYNYNFNNYKANSNNNARQFNPIVFDIANYSPTEYKSQYAGAINQLANQILNMRFSYNPNEDDLLNQAARYTTQNTFENMNNKGILNSSLTAERVARVVGELIPTYEKMAREEFESNFNMLMNTAQFIMNLDNSQYSKWQDDREMEWKREQAEYQKAQDALKNAWERVDELGYVDNDASIVLGVPVGTLSKRAREAREEREYELETWYKKQEAQQKAEKELLLLKNELERENTTYEYQLANEQLLLKNQLSNASTVGNQKVQEVYDSIIKNRFAQYDDLTRQYVVTDENKTKLQNYLSKELKAGTLSENDARILMAKYGVSAALNSQQNKLATNTAKIAANAAKIGATTPSNEGVNVSMTGNKLRVARNGEIEELEIRNGMSWAQIMQWGRELGVDLSSIL